MLSAQSISKATAAIIIAVAWTSPVYAWNALGHKVVAKIAWRELELGQRQRIADTLRRHPRFDDDFAGKMTDDVLRADKATQDRWIFQHAATWPDIAHGLPAGERSKYDWPTWHYINLPTFLDPSDRMALQGKLRANVSPEFPTSINEREYNVLQALAYSQDVLSKDGDGASKALAYCWLFHLVGDLHQPLHATALYSVDQFSEGDRGGNMIPLTRGRNLHALWDNLLGRRALLRDVDREVAELAADPQYADVWESAAEVMDRRQWAEESHELCQTVVYSDQIRDHVRGTPTGDKVEPIHLPTPYMQQAGEVARRRIIEAGLRLAKTITNS